MSKKIIIVCLGGVMAKISLKARQDKIVQILSRRNTEEQAISTREIHKILLSSDIDVSRRTIDRDIIALSATSGIVSTDQGTNRFYMSKDYKIQHGLQLTPETLQTFLIALNQLKQGSHVYFKEMATQAQTTLISALNEELRHNLQIQAQKYHFDYELGNSSSSGQADFRLILQALRENKVFTCYNKPHQKKRKFAPIIFTISSNTPYLVVQDMKDQKISKVRITLISKVQITKEFFNSQKIIESLNLKTIK